MSRSFHSSHRMRGNYLLLPSVMSLFLALRAFHRFHWELNHLSGLKIPQSHTSRRWSSLLAHHCLSFRACSSSFQALEVLALNLSLLCPLLVAQTVFAVSSLISLISWDFLLLLPLYRAISHVFRSRWIPLLWELGFSSLHKNQLSPLPSLQG